MFSPKSSSGTQDALTVSPSHPAGAQPETPPQPHQWAPPPLISPWTLSPPTRLTSTKKSTKLETIADRIDMVRDRFELLKRDAEIAYLEKIAKPKADKKKLIIFFRCGYKETSVIRAATLRTFTRHVNRGGVMVDLLQITPPCFVLHS